MIQTTVTDKNQADFLRNFSQYGFKNQEDLLSEALRRLRENLETEMLEESANLYAEIYAEDDDLQELTALASRDSGND